MSDISLNTEIEEYTYFDIVNLVRNVTKGEFEISTYSGLHTYIILEVVPTPLHERGKFTAHTYHNRVKQSLEKFFIPRFPVKFIKANIEYKGEVASHPYILYFDIHTKPINNSLQDYLNLKDNGEMFT